MSKKWYNYFVSVDEANPAADQSQTQPDSARSAAQTVADIAATLSPAPTPTTQPPAGASFEEIYTAAEIHPPDHGYTIYKIADMLQSEHIRNLPAEVKRSSILLALDAAGVKLQDIIEDAVRRDRALDTFERSSAPLKQRARGLPAPIQMSDALSRNSPKVEGVEPLQSNCLAHGRRQVVEPSMGPPSCEAGPPLFSREKMRQSAPLLSKWEVLLG